MKISTFNIENPCHENWDNMKQVQDGRFCNSCQKTVIDFSQMSDAEIIAFFEQYQGANICGQMRESQLQRPMQALPLAQQTMPYTARRISLGWRMALVGLALTGWLAGTNPAMANAKEWTRPTTEWVEELPKESSKGSLTGTVISSDGKTPTAQANVELYAGDELLATVQTNKKGVFEFKDLDLSKHKGALTFYVRAGREIGNYSLNAKNKDKTIRIVLHREQMMRGGIGRSHYNNNI